MENGVNSIPTASKEISYSIFNLVLPLLAIMGYYKKDVIIDLLKGIIDIIRSAVNREGKIETKVIPVKEQIQKETSSEHDSNLSKTSKSTIQKEEKEKNVNFESIAENVVGILTRDYSTYDGRWPITYKNEQKQVKFLTRWSRSDNYSIHVYGKQGSFFRAKNVETGEKYRNFDEVLARINSNIFDRSSVSYTAELGEIVVWQNSEGHYLLTKIDQIECEGRGYKFDRVSITYKIELQNE